MFYTCMPHQWLFHVSMPCSSVPWCPRLSSHDMYVDPFSQNSWLVGASSLLIERATATEQINTQASSLEDLLINYIPVYFSCWLKSNALTKQMRTTFWTAQKRWNVWLTLLKIWADQKMKQTRWNVWQDLNLWILDVFLENRCQASVFLRERAQVEGTESLPRKPSGSHLQTFPFLLQQHSSV